MTGFAIDFQISYSCMKISILITRNTSASNILIRRFEADIINSPNITKLCNFRENMKGLIILCAALISGSLFCAAENRNADTLLTKVSELLEQKAETMKKNHAAFMKETTVTYRISQSDYQRITATFGSGSLFAKPNEDGSCLIETKQLVRDGNYNETFVTDVEGFVAYRDELRSRLIHINSDLIETAFKALQKGFAECDKLREEIRLKQTEGNYGIERACILLEKGEDDKLPDIAKMRDQLVTTLRPLTDLIPLTESMLDELFKFQPVSQLTTIGPAVQRTTLRQRRTR